MFVLLSGFQFIEQTVYYKWYTYKRLKRELREYRIQHGPSSLLKPSCDTICLELKLQFESRT